MEGPQGLLRRHAADLHGTDPRGGGTALERFAEAWGSRYPISIETG